MKRMMRAGALVLLVALVACSQKGFETNLTIETKPVPGVDWSKYSTWKFARQGEYVLTGNEVMDDPGFRKAVNEHTIAEMQKLGYTHVNDDTATTASALEQANKAPLHHAVRADQQQAYIPADTTRRRVTM